MQDDLSGMLEILACPRTKQSLVSRNGRLETDGGEYRYEVLDRIPDLLVPPDGNVVFTGPWYDPWEDLDSLLIEYPPKSDDGPLPYHLDAYLAGCFPEKGENRWVVEVGCGERQNESWFEKRGYNYVGLDADSRGLGPNAFADAHNLPLKDSSVDFFTSMAVMEHLVSPQVFAQEIFRSLKPGGQFVGSAAFIYGFHDRASFYHMSHAGLLHCLNSSGLRVKQMWPDWKYTDSIPDWPYRGAFGFPWRIFTKASLKLAHWSFSLTSQIGRAVIRAPKLRDAIVRDIEIAGSISFIAEKPPVRPDDTPVQL